MVCPPVPLVQNVCVAFLPEVSHLVTGAESTRRRQQGLRGVLALFVLMHMLFRSALCLLDGQAICLHLMREEASHLASFLRHMTIAGYLFRALASDGEACVDVSIFDVALHG